jgi:hypothetical protein
MGYVAAMAMAAAGIARRARIVVSTTSMTRYCRLKIMTQVAENNEAHVAAMATTWIACVGLMGGRGGAHLRSKRGGTVSIFLFIFIFC